MKKSSFVFFCATCSFVFSHWSQGQVRVGSLENPTSRALSGELVEIDLRLPPAARPEGVQLMEGEREVPFQILRTTGTLKIFVAEDLKPGQEMRFRARPTRPTPVTSRVTVAREKGVISMSNSQMALELSDHPKGPGEPLVRVRSGGAWRGQGRWEQVPEWEATEVELPGFSPLFGLVRVRHTFKGRSGLRRETQPFYEMEVLLPPDRPYALVTEKFEMFAGDGWSWTPDPAVALQTWAPGQEEAGLGVGARLWPLATGRRGDWLAAGHWRDGQFLGVVAVQAGGWQWPGMAAPRLQTQAPQTIFFPTHRGRRQWLLWAGPGNRAKEAEFVRELHHAAAGRLDRVCRDYFYRWDGRSGGFDLPALWADARIQEPLSLHPETLMEGQAASARAQALMHPDATGVLWNGWPADDPGIFTRQVTRAAMALTALAEHPAKTELSKRIEARLREDLYHSVAMPGGAGQGAPAILMQQMEQWEMIRDPLRQAMGFDVGADPRFLAAATFLVRSSVREGTARRILPLGRNFPDGAKVDLLTRFNRLGLREDPRVWSSQEFPGFGVIFRDKPGTENESAVIFKSGPNRSGYGSSQLALMWHREGQWLLGSPSQTVDSLIGREEVFSRPGVVNEAGEWQPVGGFERLIGFKFGFDVEFALAELSWPSAALQDGEAKIRRSVVWIKNGPQGPYLVVRDQFWDLPGRGAVRVWAPVQKVGGDGVTAELGALRVTRALPVGGNWKTLSVSENEFWRGIETVLAAGTGEIITVLHSQAPAGPPVVDSLGIRVGADLINFQWNEKEYRSNVRPLINVERGQRTLGNIWHTEVQPEQRQGEIGLRMPEDWEGWGTPPDWLLIERTKEPPFRILYP